MKVKMISCGTDHCFAQTHHDFIYGWGRNDSG